MNTLAKQIKELREKAGFSGAELSRELGISQSAISQYENGKRDVDLKILCKYADYFSVTTDFLLGREELNRETNISNVEKEISNALRMALSSLQPHSRFKFLNAISRLSKNLAQVRQNWSDNEYETCLDFISEFYDLFFELRNSIDEFPYYDYNNVSKRTIMEHSYSVGIYYKEFHDFINKIMDSAYQRLKQNESDVN